MEDRRIGVLMGGPSAEREVSLNTGRAILAALQEKGYDAVGIDLDPPHVVRQLEEAGINIVFNAIHGRFGEDGALQGALEMLGIPYTGSGIMASSVAMDKAISKRLFQAACIPTPRSHIYRETERGEGLMEVIKAEFGMPVVIKPAAQGSSIGVVIVEKADDLPAAIQEAFRYSECILVEEFIAGKELTVAVLESGEEKAEALPIIEIVPNSGRYDYHSKYTKGATEYIVPARLDAAVTSRVQQLAKEVFVLFNCKGVARVDVMLDQRNEPYVLEINTIPGMTATSLVPKSAAAAGISFADLCERLLLMADK